MRRRPMRACPDLPEVIVRVLLASAILVVPAVALAAPVSLPPAHVDIPDDVDPGVFFDPELKAPPLGEAGKGEPPVARIVNGIEAAADQFQEVVYLDIEGLTGSESLCTGSLIHPEWVLTAAHCLDSEPEGVNIRFGPVAAESDRVVPALEWFVHEDWEAETVTYEGDIALVHLSTPVDDVFTMALNADDVDASWIGQKLTFIGFGITRSEGSGSGIKRFVQEPIVEVPVREPFLVRTYDGEHSTCQGDSGGPGVVYSGDTYVQVSVTSHGIGCGQGESGHTRVDHYLDWIRGTLEDHGGATISTRAAAPPDFACSRRINSDDVASRSIGIVPFDLACVVEYHADHELQTVTWQWGDGRQSEVSDGSLVGVHRYEDAGTFTVKMCAEGERPGEDGPAAWEHCVTRSGLVQSCGLAEVSFQAQQDDGLAYQFLNNTDLRTSFGCVYNVQWDVFEGDAATGEPIDTIASWEPLYTFPEPGEYTVVLNVGGIAGTSAAVATVRAKGSGGTRSGCAQGGGGAAGLALVGISLLAVRRRRS